jgi:outer membrane lipoprotein-sorting protein
MMTRRQFFPLCYLTMFGALCLTGLSSTAADETQSAAELAGKLAVLVEDGDSVTRLRMKIEPVNGGDDQVTQLQVKARRSKGKADVVYQMFWPKDRQGESFLILKEGGKDHQGYTFDQTNQLVTLSQSQIKDAAFGSDLSYGDVVENFFRWKTQVLAGQETVDRVDCVMLDSKPGSGDSTFYGRVRSWIDTRKMVPLRIEKYDTSGNLVRKITTTRVAKDDDGRYIPATLMVERTGSSTRTEFEGSKIRHDVELSDRDFEVEGIADGTVPR